MKIYVILGWAGEYSDRTEWVVKAVTIEEKARHLVLELENLSRELYVQSSEVYDAHEIRDALLTLDPRSEGDAYTEAHYYYTACELED